MIQMMMDQHRAKILRKLLMVNKVLRRPMTIIVKLQINRERVPQEVPVPLKTLIKLEALVSMEILAQLAVLVQPEVMIRLELINLHLNKALITQNQLMIL